MINPMFLLPHQTILNKQFISSPCLESAIWRPNYKNTSKAPTCLWLELATIIIGQIWALLKKVAQSLSKLRCWINSFPTQPGTLTTTQRTHKHNDDVLPIETDLNKHGSKYIEAMKEDEPGSSLKTAFLL